MPSTRAGTGSRVIGSSVTESMTMDGSGHVGSNFSMYRPGAVDQQHQCHHIQDWKYEKKNPNPNRATDLSTGFKQKSDCGFPGFSRTKLLLFEALCSSICEHKHYKIGF